MRGKLFQFIWHFMVKGFIKRKNGVGDNLKDYSERMIEQLKLALNFTDKIDFVIIGDSNGENLATYSNMVQLQKEIGGIGVNIAIGGTRADTWNEFLRFSHKGIDIYRFIDTHVKKVIFNIGGNHILQDKMDILEKEFISLYELFPESYNCLVPPIHIGLIAGLKGINPQVIQERVETCNNLIKHIWRNKAIDTYTPFLSPSKEPYFFVLDDLVHFSDYADKKLRIPIIIDKVK